MEPAQAVVCISWARTGTCKHGERCIHAHALKQLGRMLTGITTAGQLQRQHQQQWWQRRQLQWQPFYQHQPQMEL